MRILENNKEKIGKQLFITCEEHKNQFCSFTLNDDDINIKLYCQECKIRDSKTINIQWAHLISERMNNLEKLKEWHKKIQEYINFLEKIVIEGITCNKKEYKYNTREIEGFCDSLSNMEGVLNSAQRKNANEQKQEEEEWKKQPQYSELLECFIGSQIVKPNKSKFLIEIIQRSQERGSPHFTEDSQLLYNGKTQNFKNFDREYDIYKEFAPRLILIESDLGKCFGSFEFTAGYKEKKHEFFFSLDHEKIHFLIDEMLQRSQLNNEDYRKRYFGGGAFSLQKTYRVRRGQSNLGDYEAPELDEMLQKLNISKDDYLAGSKYFKIKEIEVYSDQQNQQQWE